MAARVRCRNSHTEGIASAPIADTDPVGVQSQQPKVRPFILGERFERTWFPRQAWPAAERGC